MFVEDATIEIRCQKCGQVYCLGKDSLVVTVEGMVSSFAFGFGMPSAQRSSGIETSPDLVDKLEHSKVKDAIDSEQRRNCKEILGKLLDGYGRWWRCLKCDCIQVYQPTYFKAKYNIYEYSEAEARAESQNKALPSNLRSLICTKKPKKGFFGIGKRLGVWVAEVEYSKRISGSDVHEEAAKETKEKTPSTISSIQLEQEKDMPSSVLDYLDKSEGTDELYEMLRSWSASKIEEVCKTFPIETLRLDWNSIQSDFHNSKRFELITVLAQILVRYEEILDQRPDLNLPKSLPAKHLADTLMSRLMPFINSQKDVELAQNPRIRLYDFAMALIQAGRDSDALTCLLVSKPSIKEDQDFWICACRFNIAQATKNPDDISAAIDSAERIVGGKVIMPQKYVQGASQMLSKLKELGDTHAF